MAAYGYSGELPQPWAHYLGSRMVKTIDLAFGDRTALRATASLGEFLPMYNAAASLEATTRSLGRALLLWSFLSKRLALGFPGPYGATLSSGWIMTAIKSKLQPGIGACWGETQAQDP